MSSCPAPNAAPHPRPAAWFRPAVLLLALRGFWAPWLTRPPAAGAGGNWGAAALQLNAYELSEWLTFLPAAQAGELPVGRLDFLLPSACLAGLFALAAAEGRRGRGRLGALLPSSAGGWLNLILGGLCALAVFPYYPYILTAYADPEFRLQFWVAAAALLGAAALQWLQDDAAALAQSALGLAGVYFTLRAVGGLWPAAGAVLGAGDLGWGVVAALAGFGGTLLEGGRRLFRPRQ